MAEPITDVCALLEQCALCWKCVAGKTGLTAVELDEALARLRSTTTIVMSLAACEGCQRNTLLYRIG